MAKIDNVQEVAIADLIPYVNNAKVHNEDQVTKIAASIREFGFLNPVLIDENKNIIAGHGRVMAARKLNLKTVPCINIDGLTETQRKAYILADNKLGELAEWDDSLVELELQALGEMDFDVELTGFELEKTWFESRNSYDNSGLEEESEEYQDFVEKFEPKRTTDDCYTPDAIYQALLDWCVDRYKINKADVVRPFYPDGDYQKEKYKSGAVVIDNPPFSILSEIIQFYLDKNIKFFLFAPSVTIFSSTKSNRYTAIACSAEITYENGAIVNTSFITNMEPSNVRIWNAPELRKIIVDINSELISKGTLPTYEYPHCIVTAAMVGKYAKYGIEYMLKDGEGVLVSALDAQKEVDKSIFGRGYIVNERKAAERKAAERKAAEPQFVWQLSDREKEIQRELNERDEHGN